MDQLVSRKLALKAMEIGFDEWCERSYMKDVKDSLSISGRNSTFEKLEIETFSAPTQTHLAKWLREKHGVHVYVTSSLTGWTWTVTTCLNGKLLSNFDYGGDNVFYGTWNSFDGALEAGLLEACDVI